MPGRAAARPDLAVGSAVRMRFRKWDDRPHWEYDARLVGEDQHGAWLGASAGTVVSRPGASFVSSAGFVSLVPHDDAYVATFYAPHAQGPGDPVELYVDITTVPTWSVTGDSHVVSMVDLDLDVVRGRSGRVWVDDEDEFADHRVRFGYPADVVALATDACARVHVAVRGGTGGFDRAHGLGWLSRLGSASAS